MNYKSAIIGAGPAGTGLLVNAISRNLLTSLSAGGLAIFEAGATFGSGSIGNYTIHSDTAAGTFTECLNGFRDSVYSDCSASVPAGILGADSSASVPLKTVGQFMKKLGRDVLKEMSRHKSISIYNQTKVEQICQTAAGLFRIDFSSENGQGSVFAEKVVLATGGKPADITGIKCIQGTCAEHKLIAADDFLKMDDVAVAAKFTKSRQPGALIVGSSHSAFSTAAVLLRNRQVKFDKNSISMLCRSRPKLFFASIADAADAGYYDLTEADVCPVTKRVNRLSGLRYQSRQLLLDIDNLKKNGKEHRVRLINMADSDVSAKELVDNADLIIAATGYVPAIVPLKNHKGVIIPLGSEYKQPLVNNHCQLIDVNGHIIPNAYGIGLASGFVPHGKMGGEPSFRGQTNGLWLYQNDVGGLIVDQLLR